MRYVDAFVIAIPKKNLNAYKKMAALGDQQAFAEGWEQIVESIATQAQSAAKDAAQQELLSSGKKNARDATASQINSSINAVENTQLAALISTIGIGSNNVKVGPVESVVKGIVESLINNFLFNGAQKTFKEQAVCAALPSATILLAKPGTGSTTPAPANDGYPGGVGGAGSD
jgi:lysozyme family protein